MNTRLIVRFICVAIVASFSSLSSAQSAVSFAVSDTMPTGLKSNRTKVAILMPRADSPLTVFANSIVNGIKAENSQQSSPYEIILLPRKNGQNALSHLQDAALLGAAVAIGPISRDDVNEVSALPFLPLPIVSLNLPQNGVSSPELMMNYSLSQEEEVKQITSIAAQALSSAEVQTPNVAIFEANAPLEHRIADAFARELGQLNIPFTRQILTEELMKQAKFYDIKDSTIPKPRLEKLPNATEDPYGYQRVKLRNERLMSQYRAKVEFEQAPYQAAFLVMDARTAALVKPRLPRTTRVWGTSLINPGNPEQSVTASLAYDLQNAGFVDSPLIVRYNDSDFKASFGVNPPSSLLERRLFAFGVDAYRLACIWMKWQSDIRMDGTTGTLSFKQGQTANVERIAQPALISNGKIETLSAEQLAQPLQRP